MGIIKENRGVSSVVATVLLILLSVIAVTLLISFVRPFVEKNLKKSTECLPYQEYFEFKETYNDGQKDISYNCWEQRTGYVLTGAMVSGKEGIRSEDLGLLDGFQVVFKDANSVVESVKVLEGATTNRNLSSIWVFNYTTNILSFPKPGDSQLYVYNGSRAFSSEEIYPVLKTGKVCEKIDSIMLKKCEAGISLS